MNVFLRSLKRFFQKLNFLYLKVYVLKGFSYEKKIDYQKRFVDFKIKPGDKVLDVGSGGEPFPYATHLVDKYPQETQHRWNELQTRGKQFIQADIEKLPFKDKEFDFVYCVHVLEHVDDAAKACDEIMRVGKRGYLETPTRMSDIMFNFAGKKDFHKWYVAMLGNTLIFHEYPDAEHRDTESDDFYHFAHAKFPNRIQKMYRKNKDLFSNMFLWENGFNYYVFDKQGDLIKSFVYRK